ncbi:hypothetical protein A3J44_05885 [candidate division WOR-1 bacterium RIFCSPHIGHO2_02_FULL_45_12]|uniref:VWFA domain-containing protein n=1 Tax=candidate division WOR-1 bacterium RIFCSPLOWO2_12_FULL_45_9 TaxID=1802568 RepID=A0A1F4RK78_UNCSA|nr:MAG: hypothetical protein A3J44_05885 [candidate division WOR-1 bacterium RIFCSPHIGHO2_02_FULL_45_12]OGC08549.1 MAG: hypothetical protein A3F86_04820 [candidate division WOR-1 bacterium RIFCSPLOWO2_12_FULL_45_9]
MRFNNLLLILLIFPLPFLYYYLKKQKPATLYHPDLGSKLSGNLPNLKFKANLPLLLRLAALLLLILALTRPQMGFISDTSNRSGVDIMVALDISSSMNAEDFKPNRIAAAKEVLTKFINGRPNDRLGLVVFGSQSYVQCPLTTDHRTLIDYLDNVYIGLAEDGTAIGMALANCVNRLKYSQAKSRVILLLTDGDNNAGEIDPKTAAKLARAMGIKIYAIGIGDPKGAPIKVKDQFGREFYARNPDGSLFLTKMNEQGLQEIGTISEGDYFIASNIGKLHTVFDKINQLEKSRFSPKDMFVFEERFYWFAFPAFWLLLLEFTVRRFYLRKVP